MSDNKGHITRVGAPGADDGPNGGITQVKPTKPDPHSFAVAIGDAVEFVKNRCVNCVAAGSGEVTHVRQLTSGEFVPGLPKGGDPLHYVFRVRSVGYTDVWSDQITLVQRTTIPVKGPAGGITRAS